MLIAGHNSYTVQDALSSPAKVFVLWVQMFLGPWMYAWMFLCFCSSVLPWISPLSEGSYQMSTSFVVVEASSQFKLARDPHLHRLKNNINCNYLCWTLSIWPFKCQVSCVARAKFNLNGHCGTVFSHSDDEVVHLMGHYCFVHLLNFNWKHTIEIYSVKSMFYWYNLVYRPYGLFSSLDWFLCTNVCSCLIVLSLYVYI
jgi:hypothetical protein